MAIPTDSPVTPQLPRVTIDDLLEPLPAIFRLGGPGPFVINLCSSSVSMTIPASVAGCGQARVYQIQRREEDLVRYRLRLGPLATEDAADALLSQVREAYPGALTATASVEDLRALQLLGVEIPTPAKPPITAPTEAVAGQTSLVSGETSFVSGRTSLVGGPPLSMPPLLDMPPLFDGPPPVDVSTPLAAPPTLTLEPLPSLAPPLSAPQTLTLEPSLSLAPPLADPPTLTLESSLTLEPPLADPPTLTLELSLTLEPPAGAPPSVAARPTRSAPPSRTGTRPLAMPPAVAAASPSRATKHPRVAPPALAAQSPRFVAAPRAAPPAVAAQSPQVEAAPRAAPLPRSVPAQPQAALPVTRSETVQSLESTQTLRRLTPSELESEGALRWYVIQLSLSETPVDPHTVPILDIFTLYRLYSVSGLQDGRVMHALRLGFFSEQIAASAVANYLTEHYDSPVITRVSVAERERFANQGMEARKDIGATGTHTAIEITGDRIVRQLRKTGP